MKHATRVTVTVVLSDLYTWPPEHDDCYSGRLEQQDPYGITYGKSFTSAREKGFSDKLHLNVR